MTATLAGRRAFAPGASSGIGAAPARALVEAGARVALAARNGEGLADVARRLDGRATSHACDVRDERQVAHAVRDAAEAMGGIDLVVSAAGLGRFAAVEDTPPDEWREILDTNLTRTFLVFRETLPHVRRARGHLFAIASIAATRPFAQSAPYSASKAGVPPLAAVAPREGQRHGVA